MKTLLTIFTYIKNIWEGSDGKPSIKACLAILFALDFIRNASFAVHKWEAGKSLVDLTGILQIEALLIAALLGITSWANLQERKIDASAKKLNGGTE